MGGEQGMEQLRAVYQGGGSKAALVGAVLAQLGHKVDPKKIIKAIDSVQPNVVKAMGLHPKRVALRMTPLPTDEGK